MLLGLLGNINKVLKKKYTKFIGFCYEHNKRYILDKVGINLSSTSGQSTVEAAIMIPIIFLMALLLLQPGIILYDKLVMENAATEGCRVLMTASDSNKSEICDSYIRRRLESIPQQDNFHVHSSGCSYEIFLNGSQNTENVEVVIKNQVKPLPLIGFLSEVLGILNESGNFKVESKSQMHTQPDWVWESKTEHNVEQWIGEWLK